MEALFGHTGPADSSASNIMSRLLAHRGSRNAQECGSDRFQVHYRDNYRSKPERDAIAQEDDVCLALAGAVFYEEEGPVCARRLLELYRRHGVNLFRQCRGFFILFLQDGDDFYLVRDGSGRRTVYYSLIHDRLYFAIEAKALHTLPDFDKRLNLPALAQYLSFSFVPGGTTMLSGIHELPAGHWLQFKPGETPRVVRYFDFEDNPEPPFESLEEAAGECERLLDRATRELMALTPHPVLFLSGGLDSSIIAAKLSELSSSPVTTLSISFGPEYPSELEFARMVARHCGTDHHELHITPKQFIPNLRRAIWHLDDPIGDPVTIPNFEMAGALPGEPEFVFNGEGGDPCFGGPKNLSMMLAHWYGGINRGPYFREKQYLGSFRRAYEELRHLLTPEVLREIDEEEHLYKVLTPYFESPRPEGFLDKLMMMNVRLKGAHLILPKVEKMLGAWNRVPLSPLFDEQLVRFSFRIPGTMKVHNGVEKIVLKEAYRHRLPSEIIQRPKSGMRVPVHYWFQKEMRSYARRILSRKAIQRVGLFRWDRVKQILDYNIAEGPGRYGLRLWMLLTFEIWRRMVLEGEEV